MKVLRTLVLLAAVAATHQSNAQAALRANVARSGTLGSALGGIALNFAECEIGDLVTLQPMGWSCLNLASIVTAVETAEAGNVQKLEAKMASFAAAEIAKLEGKIKSLESTEIVNLKAKIVSLEQKIESLLKH